MVETGITGLALTCADPGGLRRWWCAALALDAEPDGSLRVGAVRVRFAQGPAAAHELGVEVVDLHATAARLDALGAVWLADVGYRADGTWTASLCDPAGHLLLLVQHTPTSRAEQARRDGRPTGPATGAPATVWLPARDLARVRRWYADVLGLVPRADGALLHYASGSASWTVYPTTEPPAEVHTRLSFTVPDLDHAVAVLASRGVAPEAPATDREDGRGLDRGLDRGPRVLRLHPDEPGRLVTGQRAVWFRDSEGNLLALVEAAGSPGPLGSPGSPVPPGSGSAHG